MTELVASAFHVLCDVNNVMHARRMIKFRDRT
jgi:hypothetical protein